MTGAELYEKLVDITAMRVGQKDVVIDALQDALDAAEEAGRDAEEEKWLTSGAVC